MAEARRRMYLARGNAKSHEEIGKLCCAKGMDGPFNPLAMLDVASWRSE